MRRGKDDEKILEPMFPRLHVNDSDKSGGPRAPPRNKMALYEQLSIPSQRFNSHLTTTTLVPPEHSTQAFAGETALYLQQRVSSSARVHTVEEFVTQGSMRNVRSLAQYGQRKIVGEEDDFSVPVFVNSRRAQPHGTNKDGSEKEKPASSVAPSLRHSSEIQEVNPKGLKQNDSLPTCSEYVARERVKENMKQSDFMSSLYLSAREENFRDASVRQDSRDRFGGDGETCEKDSDNGVESQLQRESNSGRARGSPDEVGNGDEYGRGGEQVYQQQRNEETGDGVSESSMVDSISSANVSPDDIVEVIGQKRFWRARKAINNQQRLFAVQVFELHRLIKVQRLIAASPDLLLDDGTYLERVSPKSSPVKKLLPSEYILKPIPRVAKHRDDTEKSNNHHKMECSAENAFGRTHVSPVNPPSPAASNGSHKTHAASNGSHKTHMGDNGGGSGGWCFPPQPPPGNHQWLIPVMSPSEGLIYKPYPGPGPGPGPGNPGPGCGGYYGHFNYTGGPTYSVPTPAYHPGVGYPSYFPPYAMPNCSWQQPPPEQMMNHHQFGHSGNTATSTQQQSSCNYPPNSSTISRPAAAPQPQPHPPPKKPQPRRRECSNGSEPQLVTKSTTVTTRVIRVVPHNARLASENAARIFQSIQEERKHHERL